MKVEISLLCQGQLVRLWCRLLHHHPLRRYSWHWQTGRQRNPHIWILHQLTVYWSETIFETYWGCALPKTRPSLSKRIEGLFGLDTSPWTKAPVELALFPEYTLPCAQLSMVLVPPSSKTLPETATADWTLFSLTLSRTRVEFPSERSIKTGVSFTTASTIAIPPGYVRKLAREFM